MEKVEAVALERENRVEKQSWRKQEILNMQVAGSGPCTDWAPLMIDHLNQTYFTTLPSTSR